MFGAVLLMTGCIMPALPDLSPPIIVMPDPEDFLPDPYDEEDTGAPLRPGRFTLRYGPEDTMNPITALNRDNINLASLIYESLFTLNDELIAEPLLVADWHTEDYITFTFEILPNITMHDGLPLTADDVAYSLRQAQQRGRHVAKLISVSSIDSDGELTVTIVLSEPNARFTRLLDIPIIREGSIESRIPPGTGPYVFVAPEAFLLIRFTGHRYFQYMPLAHILLIECLDAELTGLFDGGELSLVWDDPIGAFEIRLNRPHEPRLYNTTSFQYIGFNTDSLVLRSSDVRRAISNSINRQLIVDEIMNSHRPNQAIAAPASISPIFDMYDTAWEFVAQDPIVEMAILLEMAGLADIAHDGFLQINDGFGTWSPFVLDFIVNIENSHKVAAAHVIADNLIRNGINVEVRTLPWSLFMEELQAGNFDMFYGETMLRADQKTVIGFAGVANILYRVLDIKSDRYDFSNRHISSIATFNLVMSLSKIRPVVFEIFAI